MPPRLSNDSPSITSQPAETPLSARRVLVIDPSNTLPDALRGVSGTNVTIARFSMLTVAFLAEVAPDVVLAPLVSPGHDILDLAHELDAAGYTGQLRAYSAPLPNLALVRSEVRQIWGKRDFDILELPEQFH